MQTQKRADKRNERRRRSTRPRPFTYEKLCAMPDDGKRYEIFEGELSEMTPSPTPRHQDVVLRLLRIMDSYVSATHLGKVYVAPLDVVLNDRNVYEPDILFIARDHLSIIGEKHITAAPDLAVEILSGSGARDRVKKRRQYQKFGVRHYWIIDPTERTLEEYVLKSGVYRPGAVLEGDDVFRPAIFRKLEIPLAKIWA